MNLTEKVCSVCGKSFIPGVQHIYKTSFGHTTYQCSYACWNVAKTTHKPKEYASRRREQG